MDFIVKTYDELTKNELYAILKARINVFVVEQRCPYPDLDGIDKQALHIFALDGEGDCTAYMRAFVLEQGVVQIGRVLTLERGVGIGGALLSFAIKAITERYAPKKLFIEAQTHAAGFYRREGFRVVGKEFEADGIPHVQMELELVGHEHKKILINGEIEIPMDMSEADFMKRFNGFLDSNAWSFGGKAKETVEVEYVEHKRPLAPEEIRAVLVKAGAAEDEPMELAPPEGPIDVSPHDEAVRRSRFMRSERRGRKRSDKAVKPKKKTAGKKTGRR